MNLRKMANQTEPNKSPDVGVLVEEQEKIDTPWRVMLYNDEIHTFEEVINQLTKAVRCSASQAEKIALKVHSEGKALVYEGDFEPCFEVNSILKEIQLVTEIKG